MSKRRRQTRVPTTRRDPERIAVTMIVRDAAGTLARSLGSVRPHVDAVYVLDTGSADGTLELLAELAEAPGAPIHVTQGGWHDDFARARNEALSLIPDGFTWALALDADEVLHGGENLRRLLRKLPRNDDGLVVLENYVNDAAGDSLAVVAFQAAHRLGAGLRWDGVLHATLEPLRDGRWTLAPADELYIEHLCTLEQFLGRLPDWRRLLLKERSLQARLQLAEIELHLGETESAVDTLQGCLHDPDLNPEDGRRVVVALAYALLLEGQFEDAASTLFSLLAADPLTPLSPQALAVSEAQAQAGVTS